MAQTIIQIRTATVKNLFSTQNAELWESSWHHPYKRNTQKEPFPVRTRWEIVVNLWLRRQTCLPLCSEAAQQCTAGLFATLGKIMTIAWSQKGRKPPKRYKCR